MKISTPFLPSLPRLQRWLSPADEPQAADLIFVLAGKVNRKEYGLELSRRGLAPSILFSVGRFEIRRFSKMSLPISLDLLKLAQEVPPPQRHYFVFFQNHEVQVEHTPPRRFGTLMEVKTLAKWLSAHPEIRSILIISSSTHLRRIRLCCRSLLKPDLKIAYVATPELFAISAISEGQARHRNGSKTERNVATDSRVPARLLELFKILVYWVLLKVR